jgi:RNA polymerase sigma-70 factor (ECF subfamily)
MIGPIAPCNTAMDKATCQAPASRECASNPAEVRREIASLLPELRAYARLLARDRSKSDDLVQDTVVRALASLAQFQPGTSLKAWMFTILRNAFYEQVRRRRREDAAMALHAQTAGEGLQTHHGDITDLSQLLWSLPPLLREALVLVGAQEMTHEEAASICGVPVGTMRARVSRARRQLSLLVPA